MGLPIPVEQALAAVDDDLERVRRERADLSRRIAELAALADLDEDVEEEISDAIPEETFDDPSVVRQVERVRKTAERVRRSSGSPVMTGAAIAGAAVASPPRARGTPEANRPPTEPPRPGGRYAKRKRTRTPAGR